MPPAFGRWSSDVDMGRVVVVMRSGVARSVAVAWLASVLALVMVSTAGPARAEGLSSVGPSNAGWMALDAANARNEMNAAGTSLTAAEGAAFTGVQARGITKKVSTNPLKGRLKGRAGLIVNTIVAVASLAFVFGEQGQDALPPGPAGAPVQPPYEGGTGNGCIISGAWVLTVCEQVSYRAGISITGNPEPPAWWPVYRPDGSVGSVFSPAYGMSGTVFQAGPGTSTLKRCTTYAGGVYSGCAVMGSLSIAPNGSYYPAQTPGPGDPNPNRTITQTNKCEKPDGTQYIRSQDGTPFKAPNGLLVEAPVFEGLACDAGDILAGSDTGVKTEGVAGSVPLTQPYVRPDWVKQQQIEYPNCAPVGATQCKLELFRLSAPALNCHTVAAGQTHACRLWATDAAKATNYECRYGGAVLALARCEPYREVFKSPTALMQPTPGTEGAPAATVIPAGDPLNCTSGQACDAPEDTSCFPSGWAAFNPVNWVYQPMVCGLTWAFVPKATALQTNLVTDQLNRAGVTPSIDALTAVVSTLGGESGGCTGPVINFDIPPVHQAVTPFAACTAPMSTVAGFVFALTSVVVVVAGGYKFVAVLAAGFGYTTAPPQWEQGTLF